MSRETERRAAQLVESRFGLAPALVRAILQDVLRAQANGSRADMVTVLLDRRLLTPVQGEELSRLLREARTSPELAAHPGDNGVQNDSLAVTDALIPAQARAAPDSRIIPVRLGDYRIVRKLGEGGMCPVFLAENLADGQQVAIKVLPLKLASHPPTLERFYREARSGALLAHPNIVRNLGVGEDQITLQHYLVMEYVDGYSAQTLLECFGRLPVPEAVRIVLDTARGLEHAHWRNVIHRDIKPDNILITRQGVVKLADLGLAKRLDDPSHLTATRQGFGTPHYMPPEQALNARNADGRSDLYALGATLYHLLVGDVPFQANSQVEVVEKKKQGTYPPPSRFNPEVPPVLERILEKLMAADPRARYQTVRELIADLELTNLAAPPLQPIARLLTVVEHAGAEGVSDSQPTARDLRQNSGHDSGVSSGNSDIWYIRYRDPAGQVCKTRASVRQIHKRLREGKLPADSEVGRSLQGEFKPLKSYAEFQPPQKSSLPEPAPPRPARSAPVPVVAEEPDWFLNTGQPSWPLYLAAGLLLAILTTLGVVLKVLLAG